MPAAASVLPDWLRRFPALASLSPEAAATLSASARVVAVPHDTRLFSPGDQPTQYLLALSGSIRVQKASDTGREIVLYRVSPGESCVLTTACLIGREAYEAEAIAESDVEAVIVPGAVFDDLVARDDAFRRFVFSSFSSRITDLLRLIDEVAFARIDTRLAHKLDELADAQGAIAMTQQQMAAELGTAREVVSRQLQEFQRQGWIALARGSILLTGPGREALKRYGRGEN